MIKKLCFLLLCFVVFKSIGQNVGRISRGNPQTIIDGELKEFPNDSTITVFDPISGSWDSTKINNHCFTFNLPMTYGGAVYIIQLGSLKQGVNPIDNGTAVALYLDSGHVVIKGSTFKNAKFSGPTWVKDWQDLQPIVNYEEGDEYPETIKKYKAALAIGDEDAMDLYRKQMDDYIAVKQIEFKKWIKSHTNSRVAGYLITVFFGQKHKVEDSLFNQLTSYAKQSLIYKSWSEPGKWGPQPTITLNSGGTPNIPGQPKPGAVAPNIQGLDVNDKKVALSDFKGKYVLIDFWASWCAPCRAAMPALKESYNKVKDKKDFVLLGVSLDTKKEGWVKAISKDGIPWLNISNLKGWGEPASGAFGIRAIPANVLIDPDGKIVAYNLFGEALDKKLSEVLK